VSTSTGQPRAVSDELSILELATILIRRRRLIVGLLVAGILAGVAITILSPRTYRSSAVFLAQGESHTSDLAMAMSQFGFRVPSGTGSSWGAPVYVELLRSQALLEPLATQSIAVVEEGGRLVSVLDLLGVPREPESRRLALGVRELRRRVRVTEDKSFGAVRLSVDMPRASASYEIAKWLITAVTDFNQSKRRSQAGAERQFAEGQAAEAAEALERAEKRLETFLTRNRSYRASPELLFEHERLTRDVAMKQELYASWVKNREDARIREVRNLPIITLLEEPRLPGVPESRQTPLYATVGGLGGLLLGLAIALMMALLQRARVAPEPDAREFFEIVQRASPRFFRRSVS
jgi:uncharacterized protein involved in exopolysaccharide biosynthesis